MVQNCGKIGYLDGACAIILWWALKQRTSDWIEPSKVYACVDYDGHVECVLVAVIYVIHRGVLVFLLIVEWQGPLAHGHWHSKHGASPILIIHQRLENKKKKVTDGGTVLPLWAGNRHLERNNRNAELSCYSSIDWWSLPHPHRYIPKPDNISKKKEFFSCEISRFPPSKCNAIHGFSNFGHVFTYWNISEPPDKI